MATETPELTQNEPSEARRARSPSVAHAWQEQLAGDGSPTTPMLQLALAAGTVLVMAGAAMLSGVTLVPPPPSMRVQALTAAPARPRAVRPPPAAPAAVVEAAALPPTPAPPQAAAPAAEPAPAAAEPAPAAAEPARPSPAALPAAAPAEPPARRVEAASKSHGKKPHRPPTSTRKRASAKPGDSSAPAATRPRRSAS